MSRSIDFARKYGIAVIAVAVFIALAATTEGFATSRNLRNILDQ